MILIIECSVKIKLTLYLSFLNPTTESAYLRLRSTALVNYGTRSVEMNNLTFTLTSNYDV